MENFRLKESYFEKDTHAICHDLIGKFLIRQNKKSQKVGQIVEVEAYQGFDDKASHASRKKTSRNEVMYSKGGHYYIYLIYGMYYCLNIVTEKKGFPAAVLIRAVEPIYDSKQKLGNLDIKGKRILGSGPGLLCRWLAIDRGLNCKSVENESLYLLDSYNGLISHPNIKKTKRVGVNYAGESAHLEWRYYDTTSSYITKK